MVRSCWTLVVGLCPLLFLLQKRLLLSQLVKHFFFSLSNNFHHQFEFRRDAKSDTRPLGKHHCLVPP